MPVASMNTIQQQVTIRSPRSRVWKALTTPSEFGTWFHATLSATDFRPGERVNAVSTYPKCEGMQFVLDIVEKVPEERLVWRWSPGLATSDDSPTTVAFTLEDVGGNTRVTVSESGFEGISVERRAKAFEDNTQGWKIQMQNLSDYAEQNR